MGLIGIDLHTDSFYVVRTRLTDKGQIRTEKKYELHGESWRLFTNSLSKEDYPAFLMKSRKRPFFLV